MPFDISQHPDYFVLRLTGTLVGEDLENVAHAVGQLEDAGPLLNRVTDLTGIELLNVAFPEVQALADRRRSRRFASPVKSALLAHKPLHIGYARMFQSLNDNPFLQVRLVKSMDEALNWFAE